MDIDFADARVESGVYAVRLRAAKHEHAAFDIYSHYVCRRAFQRHRARACLAEDAGRAAGAARNPHARRRVAAPVRVGTNRRPPVRRVRFAAGRRHRRHCAAAQEKRTALKREFSGERQRRSRSDDHHSFAGLRYVTLPLKCKRSRGLARSRIHLDRRPFRKAHGAGAARHRHLPPHGCRRLHRSRREIPLRHEIAFNIEPLRLGEPVRE